MNEKLDGRTKWCYSIGATGRDMAYTLVSMFLMTYIQYTMRLSVSQFGAISIIIFVCLIWDAFNDPLMGVIVENSHLKHGKYRPWIMMGAVLNAIVIILLFTVRPTGWLFVLFFGIGYLSWGMTYTMNDIAYWGMLPSLTSNPKERNGLVTAMSIFICVGQFTVAGLLPTLVAGNAVKAYRIAAVVIALCFVLFQMLTFFGVREKPRKEENKEDKLSLKDMFQILKRNDQLLVIGIGSLLYNVGGGLLIMFGMNFFYFEFGYAKGGGLILIFTVMYGLGTLISQMVFPLFTKFFKRESILKMATAAIIIGYICWMMIGYVIPKNVILLNVIGFVIFFSQGLYNLVIIIMLNNTIEYDEYRFHERHESIISAVRSFTAKLASAINQGIVALVLIISGIYTISQHISNLEIEAGIGNISGEQVRTQAEGYISLASGNQTLILRIGMVIIPILAFGICMALLHKKYIINEEKYDEMVAETAKRRENLK